VDNNGSRSSRGGAFDSFPPDVRSSSRASFEPGLRFYDLGFRLARSVR
jgi:formylglycine-generating enzyme required for sulfatase activity